jgi:pyrroline-5-carboxylate reductase
MEILELMGHTFEVEENELEAYAIVSAMLPTYFWFQWQEIERLGQEMGLTAVDSRSAIRDTLVSSVHLLYDSGLSQEEVIDLIPVKPIGENEGQIKEILQTRLMGLFNKIKP